MSSPHDNHINVSAAFDMLLEQVDAEIAAINREGAEAFTSGDYSKAREVLDRGAQVKAFRERVVSLRDDWGAIAAGSPSNPEQSAVSTSSTRNDSWEVSLPARGVRHVRASSYLSLEAYLRPILTAITEQGGTAGSAAVLSRVEQLVQEQLGEADYQTLPSTPDTPRWRAIAHGARYHLVRDGMIDPSTPRGIWKITEKGRQWLVARPVPQPPMAHSRRTPASERASIQHRTSRNNVGRGVDGEPTPPQAYFIPILTVLSESGGSCSSGQVLNYVEQRMIGRFMEADLESTSSSSRPRWKSFVHRAHQLMLEEGLVLAGSPIGIWEISDKGRSYLEAHDSPPLQPKQEPPRAETRQWDEASFFEHLQEHADPADVEVARRLYNWALDRHLRIWWGKGNFSGSFFPLIDQGRTTQFTFAVWTTPKSPIVELQFQWMKGKAPFDDEARRRELQVRLNAIPGIDISDEALDKRPSTPLATLRDPSAMQLFLDTLDWVVDQVRNP